MPTGIRIAKSEWKTGPSPGSKSPIGSVESSLFRLFREAAQLKTVGSSTGMAETKACGGGVQIQTADAFGGGRPDESVVADVCRYAFAAAEARGGLLSSTNANRRRPLFRVDKIPCGCPFILRGNVTDDCWNGSMRCWD